MWDSSSSVTEGEAAMPRRPRSRIPRTVRTVRTIDDVWRERVDEGLEDLGQTRAWLAREVPCTRATITIALRRGRPAHSFVAARIEEVLRMEPLPPPPLEAPDDEVLAEIVAKIPHLPPNSLQLVVALVRDLYFYAQLEKRLTVP